MSDLVGNPEDRFSCDAAYMSCISTEHVPREDSGQHRHLLTLSSLCSMMGTFFHVNNKDSNQTRQIPWLMCVFFAAVL